MKMHINKQGFTLVELMVVAVIVAILASVAIPLMTANKKRAMATEAEAGLGHVRTALRASFAQTSAYNVDLDGGAIAVGAIAGAVPGISVGDLDGRYFDDTAYTITAIGANTYSIQASGTASTAPQAADVAGVVIALDDAGAFTRTGL
ncbi:MAG: type IV pilus assembly protein PilE [Kiritimatiellia bacterium]|jgi:type IV pilus assembly protein PilE